MSIIILVFFVFPAQLYKNDIRSDLHYLPPRDHQLLCRCKQSPKMAAFRYYKCADTSAAFIKFYICHMTKRTAVLDIDHCFFTQTGKTHKKPPAIISSTVRYGLRLLYDMQEFSCRYTLKRNRMISPSCTTYSFPSKRTRPFSFAAVIVPHLIRSS